MLHVLIIGLGGVGTIAAYVLEKSGQARVTAVLRSNYAAVQAEGFDIESVDHGRIQHWRPSTICPSLASITAASASFDYIVVTTKCHPSQRGPLLATLRPLVRPGQTSIVLLQNGLDIEPPFAQAFPSTPVLSGVSMIGSRLTAPNRVLHEDPDAWKLGAFLHGTLAPERQTAAAQRFMAVYNAGLADAMARRPTGAGCTLVRDVVAARWQKLLWNGTFNTLCTLLQVPVGELMSSPGRETLVAPAMQEMAAIARAAGYGSAVTDEAVRELLTGTPADSPFRPSMLVDYEKRRPFELDVILGAPLKVARQHGVETPVLDRVYDLLQVLLWQVTREDRG